MVSALGEVINDGVIHPEEKVKVRPRQVNNSDNENNNESEFV